MIFISWDERSHLWLSITNLLSSSSPSGRQCSASQFFSILLGISVLFTSVVFDIISFGVKGFRRKKSPWGRAVGILLWTRMRFYALMSKRFKKWFLTLKDDLRISSAASFPSAKMIFVDAKGVQEKLYSALSSRTIFRYSILRLIVADLIVLRMFHSILLPSKLLSAKWFAFCRLVKFGWSAQNAA
jgi:hypothetical protein